MKFFILSIFLFIFCFYAANPCLANDLFFPGLQDGSIPGVVVRDDVAVMELIPLAIELITKFLFIPILAMFIYAGFNYVIAGDDDEKINNTKDFLKFGLIGLVIIVISFSLMKTLYFIFYSNEVYISETLQTEESEVFIDS